MDLEAYIYYVLWISFVIVRKSEGLKCFECDNNINPACGVFFKSYQFNPIECNGGDVKCGLQRQQPLKEEDNFIGILRRCYYTGTLPGVDETDGCRSYIMPPHNFTFLYCFCSEDYCNSSHTLTSQTLTAALCSALILILCASFCR